MGGIPIVTKFAGKKHPPNIRLEAAAFVRQMYQTSTLTLQMFVSCGGLNVLVEFLEEDYEAQKDLVLIGINGIWSVFELQVRFMRPLGKQSSDLLSHRDQHPRMTFVESLPEARCYNRYL